LSPPTVQKVQAENPSAWAVFNPCGEKLSENHRNEVREIASHSESYYSRWNSIQLGGDKKRIGIGITVGGFEAGVGALILALVERSSATILNFLTSLQEVGQAIVSGLEWANANLDEIKDEKKREEVENELKERARKREVALASLVSVAACGGLYKWGREYSWGKDILHIFDGDSHDIKEVPLWQKIGLTIGSFLSMVAMAVGYVEKSLMATVAQSKNGGVRAKEIIINAKSDLRCTIEWFCMGLFLWVRKIRPLKMLIDLGLPLNALQDGVGHLLEPLLESEDSSSNIFIKALKKIFKDSDEIKTPVKVFNGWFFGKKENTGLRSRVFTGVYKAFGCEPLDCHLDESSNLVVRVPKAAA